MPRKTTSNVKFCDATGLPILCTKCFRPAKVIKPRKRSDPLICDYHKAIEEFRKLDKVDDVHVFDLPVFIQRIDWNKVVTSCQPELRILFKQAKSTSDEIARRVV